MKASELDKKFDDGEEDILQYFDLSKARRPNREVQRVNVDFTVGILRELDAEAARLGVTRQSLIKIWVGERLKSSGSA